MITTVRDIVHCSGQLTKILKVPRSNAYRKIDPYKGMIEGALESFRVEREKLLDDPYSDDRNLNKLLDTDVEFEGFTFLSLDDAAEIYLSDREVFGLYGRFLKPIRIVKSYQEPEEE